jgi:acetate kinase
MNSRAPCVLTINAGSSSIRFAIYACGASSRLRAGGIIDRVDAAGMRLTVDDDEGRRVSRRLSPTGTRGAIGALFGWLQGQAIVPVIAGVGHRGVHVMKHWAPVRVTPALLAELRRITPHAPEHLPARSRSSRRSTKGSRCCPKSPASTRRSTARCRR